MARKPVFSPSSQFWEDALQLRKPPHYLTYDQIAVRLREKGLDVSTRQVRDSMVKYAPLALRLPERAGDYLRRTHGEYLETFNNWQTLELLILDTIAELGKLNQQLEDETIDDTARDHLTMQRQIEIERAWRFAKELEELRRELDPGYVPASARGQGGPNTNVTVTNQNGDMLPQVQNNAFFANIDKLEAQVLEMLGSSAVDKFKVMLNPGNVSGVGEGGEEEVKYI